MTRREVIIAILLVPVLILWVLLEPLYKVLLLKINPKMLLSAYKEAFDEFIRLYKVDIWK